MTADPYVVLRDYWRWNRFVQPAPRYLSALLQVVGVWVINGNESGVLEYWVANRSLVESELRRKPEFSPLFDACTELINFVNVQALSVGMDPKLQALVIQYERLAKSVAWKVWKTAPTQLELDELMGIANFGLVAAADRWPEYCIEHNYNPEHVQYFQEFATRRIRGAIYDTLRSNDWVTRKVRTNARMLAQAGQESGATHAELAERTGLTPEEITETLIAMTQEPVSLEVQEVDFTAPELAVESQLVTKQILDVCVGAVQRLSKEQQQVLVLRYYCGMSLNDIAAELETSRVKISSLHIDAVLAVHAAMLAYADENIGG